MSESATMEQGTGPEYEAMAFPLGDPSGQQFAPQFGMTLRDYFAGKALSAMELEGREPAMVASVAYRVADAMMRERDKP